MKRAVLPLLLLAGLLALSGCARSVRREPPALTVACAGAEWAAQRGGYSWSYRSGLRGRTSVVADTAHPLQCVGDGSLTAIPRGGENRLSLRFAAAPDRCEARCWSDAQIAALTADGDLAADAEAQATALTAVNGELTLPGEGGFLVAVRAEWGKETPGGFGTAEYVFYIG